MGLNFEYPPGVMPLDPDDTAGLIPSHITTQGQLNEWEFQNVAEGREWALSRKRTNLLTTEFAQNLHRRMFRRTWKWAAEIRTKETSVGIDPGNIRVELKKLFDDATWQIKEKSMPLDEIAARFHHRLTQIHPFRNGNGRHARLHADIFVAARSLPPLTWGAALDLEQPGLARTRYIAALRSADQGDYAPLLAFASS